MNPLTSEIDMHITRPARHGDRRRFLGQVVAAGLGAAAAPSILAACSNKSTGTSTASTSTGSPSPSSTSSTPAPSSPSTPAAAAAPATPGVLYPKGYVGPRATEKKPFYTGGQTFTVVVPEDSTVVGDWNKNQMTAWFAKRTGVPVKFQTVSTTNNDMTKVNAMIASGDLPDAFMGIPFSRDQISLYGQQGVFVPLDQHIDTYATELQHAYTGYPDMKTLAKSTDGKTYAFPSLNDCFHCHVSPSRAWVNKTFVDAGGGKIPQTTQDLRTFLKALQTNDADGHGDTVPLAAGVSNAIDRFFMNAFLYNPGDPWLRLDNGQVDFVANKAQWRAALAYLRSLFDDGTLSPQLFTMTDQALQKLGNNPGHARIGVARCYYWGSFMDIDQTDPKARWHDYVPVPALKGPDGVHYAAWDYYTPYILNGFVVTKNCRAAATMVAWADYQMELTATMVGYDGTAGKNWGWAKKGATSIAGKQAVWQQATWPAPVGQSWNQYSVMYRSNDYRLGQQTDPTNPAFAAQLYRDSLAPYYASYQQPKDFQLPPLIFDQASAATNADTALSITNLVNQSMAQFATAKLDIHDDNVWKTYTDKIDKIGLTQYLRNYQHAYDSRPKA